MGATVCSGRHYFDHGLKHIFMGEAASQKHGDVALKNNRLCSFQVRRSSGDADKASHRFFAQPRVNKKKVAHCFQRAYKVEAWKFGRQTRRRHWNSAHDSDLRERAPELL